MPKHSIDYGSQIAGWIIAIEKASIMMLHPTSKFRCLYFLSDVLVVLYVLTCAEFLHQCTGSSA